MTDMDRVVSCAKSLSLSRNIICVNVARFKTHALIDTGAFCSIASDNFVKILAVPVRHLEEGDIKTVHLADGKPIEDLGRVSITVKIHGLAIPCECRVLPNVAYDLILGLDFLEANKAQIDFGNRIITFHDNLTVASLVQPRNESNMLFPKNPHSEVLVPMAVPKNVMQQLCLIEPLPPQRQQKFLAARGLVNTESTATVCKVMNPTAVFCGYHIVDHWRQSNLCSRHRSTEK